MIGEVFLEFANFVGLECIRMKLKAPFARTIVILVRTLFLIERHVRSVTKANTKTRMISQGAKVVAREGTTTRRVSLPIVLVVKQESIRRKHFRRRVNFVALWLPMIECNVSVESNHGIFKRQVENAQMVVATRTKKGTFRPRLNVGRRGGN